MSIKAFELVPAIERVNLMSEKAKTQIVCIECCGKNVYLGTDDCYVVHYVVDERSSPGAKVLYSSQKQGHKYLGLKKPVLQLKAASALNRILVLCDNSLTLLSMFDLEPILSGAKIKGVQSFCLNQNPQHGNPFSVEVCVSLRKKSLQVYTVTEDRMALSKEVALPELPVAMSMDGVFICVALASQYKMVNCETARIQDLFPYDADAFRPIVTKITGEEFLLSAPSALGMFASASGMSQRPPLQWSDNLVSVVYTHPYILALNDEFITVHSILDQLQKQSIPFQGGLHLGEFDGRIFIATGKEVYTLVQVPIEKQIQALLADKRVTEALDLAKNARKTGLSKERFLKMFRRIQQQAGFIEFSQMNFEEARQLFRSGQIDIRELLTLYPHLMPSNSDFTRSVPPLHEIADIAQITHGNQESMAQYKAFLRSYLEDSRGTKDALGCQRELDTALLKLYAEVDSVELHTLIVADSACDVEDCVPWLLKFHRYHSLALLYQFHKDNDRALSVWTRIVNGELPDESFPGIEFIVEFLTNLNNHDLVWKYVDWVLEKDQLMGVTIFTERPTQEALSDRLRPDLVVDFLARYPTAVIIYLQYLVFQQQSQDEKFHTHLAVLYLDRVLKLQQDPSADKTELVKARSELRHLLQVSSLYRVQLILGKVRETELHPECAILYGKLEEHDKALRLLVHKLRDFSAAENYCIVNSRDRDLAYRKRLFHVLLGVYLDPNNERQDSLVAPAVSLLNNNKADFDTVKVLQLLPDNWSIGLLSQFLSSSVRKSLNGSRTTHIERMLARGQNLQTQKESIELLTKSVPLADDRLCAVCNRGFNEPSFMHYPNGVITHVHCAKNRFICPITGKLFNVTAAPTHRDVGTTPAALKDGSLHK